MKTTLVLKQNNGLPALNIQVFNTGLTKPEAAGLVSQWEAQLEEVLKAKKTSECNCKPPPSYEDFRRRLGLKDQDNAVNYKKFERLREIKIEQMKDRVGLSLPCPTLTALKTNLSCETALDVVMLPLELLLSGVGIGKIGFIELCQWFSKNYQLSPWTGGQDPQKVYTKYASHLIRFPRKPGSRQKR